MENHLIDYKSATSVEIVSKIASALRIKLIGKLLIECFSQNKDELILGFGDAKEDCWIKANFDVEIGLLSFPEIVSRAKKNSVDIFAILKNLKVCHVHYHQNERSFHLEFEQNYDLIFKLHGKNSNLILVQNFKTIDVFKHNLQNDFKIDILNYVHDNQVVKYESVLENLTNFYSSFTKDFYITKQKKQAFVALQTKIKSIEKYLFSAKTKLNILENHLSYDKIGHILMANLHLNILNQNAIKLLDFYTNSEIEIKLKPLLSLQKNAEIYYRKAKNQKIEVQKTIETIATKEKELAKLELLLSEINNAENIKEITKKTTNEKLLVPKQKIAQQTPYHEHEHEGFKIWIGKNAQQNDVLTLKFAHKEDLWLHAKDSPGSHVIIKFQAGKIIPKTVIEQAASWAAFFSKRKNEGLVPVIVTSKKFVRKPKGLPQGSVIVDKEDVILVKPQKID